MSPCKGTKRRNEGGVVPPYGRDATQCRVEVVACCSGGREDGGSGKLGYGVVEGLDSKEQGDTS
jgi:hypothetical protein